MPWRARVKPRNHSACLPAMLASEGGAIEGGAARAGRPRRSSSALICPSNESLPRGLRKRGGTNGVRLTHVALSPSSATGAPPTVRNDDRFPMPMSVTAMSSIPLAQVLRSRRSPRSASGPKPIGAWTRTWSIRLGFRASSAIGMKCAWRCSLRMGCPSSSLPVSSGHRPRCCSSPTLLNRARRKSVIVGSALSMSGRTSRFLSVESANSAVSSRSRVAIAGMSAAETNESADTGRQ